jgi:hypothetical protein
LALEKVVSSQFYDGDLQIVRAKDNPFIGIDVKGIQEVARTICKAHLLVQEEVPRYRAIGWDAMKCDSGEWVIFEGNLCCARMDCLFYCFS